jgi:hypothetical protein
MNHVVRTTSTLWHGLATSLDCAAFALPRTCERMKALWDR